MPDDNRTENPEFAADCGILVQRLVHTLQGDGSIFRAVGRIWGNDGDDYDVFVVRKRRASTEPVTGNGKGYVRQPYFDVKDDPS